MTSTEETKQTGQLTDAQRAEQKRRNLVIAFSLVGFAVLVFLVTVIRLSQNIATNGAAG